MVAPAAIPIITAIGRFAAPYLAKELGKIGNNKFIQTYGKDAFTSLNETLAAETPMVNEDNIPMVNTAFADLTVPGVIAPDAEEMEREAEKIREMTKPIGFPADPPIKPDIKTGDTTPPKIDTTEEFPSEEEKLPNIEGFPSDTKQLPVIFEQRDVKKQTEQALEPKVEFGRLTSAEKQTAIALKGDAPDFYSRVVKSIEDAKPNKLTKNKWKSFIQADKNEIKYLGLDKFLQGNESITKKELLDFVQEKNLAPYIKVTEGSYEDIAPEGMANTYESYTLGFGENKEFITFQIDKDFYNDDVVFRSQHGGAGVRDNMFAHARTQVGIGDPDSPPADYGSNAKEITEKLEDTLIIDEIQSDWLQRLNKYGPLSQYNIVEEVDPPDAGVITGVSVYDKDGELVEEFNDYDFRSGTPVSREAVEDLLVSRGDEEAGIKAAPDFPIVESKKWVELILNEMIKKAVYEDRDSIATTSGQIQKLRYEGMDEENAEGLKKFYDDIVTPQLEKIAKNYGVKIEKISIEDPTANVYDNELIGINTRMREAMDAGYELKKVNAGTFEKTLLDLEKMKSSASSPLTAVVPDFFTIFGKESKGQGALNILNVIDLENDYTSSLEKPLNDYYIWVLKDSKLSQKIDDINSNKNVSNTLADYFLSNEERPTAYGSAIRPSVKFDMPASYVDEGIEPEATIPAGTGPNDLAEAETVRVTMGEALGELPDNTNYSAYLMNQYIKNRKDAENYGLQDESDQQIILKMRLPKKLQKDILRKPIKISKAKTQTDRLFA